MSTQFRGNFGGDDPGPGDNTNTVITEDSMEAILAISEGPIWGLVAGTMSFYLGDTPLQSPDGSYNYTSVALGMFPGNGETITSTQGGFGAATNVSVEMLRNVPVTRTINTLGIDFIDLRILVNRLYTEDAEGHTSPNNAQLTIEWRPDNVETWYLIDSGGNNPRVDFEGYTVYGDVTINRGPVAYWSASTPSTLDITTGIWFYTGANNVPFLASSGSWVGISNAEYVLGTPSSLPYWTWRQYDEVGTLLRSRAWIGPSTSSGLLFSSEHGGDPRAGDYWLQTDTGVPKYFNGNNWLTANDGVADPTYLPEEYVGTGVVSLYQKVIASPVVWQLRFPVPRINVPIQVRVTKTTVSTHDDIPRIFSDTTWESAIAQVARQFKYDNLAIAQINAQASGSFASIPEFSGIYFGRIIKVPSNYDPTAKTYSSVWDGLWVLSWSDNPAFIAKDLVENTTYGMGAYYQITLNDWDVYDAGQWCDHRTPDGNPRFTFNGIIADPRIGKEAIDYICGIFGGRFVDDGNGFARILIDRSDIPAVQLFTKENVEAGLFSYTFSDPSTRYNDLTIAFTNPDINWQTDRRRLYWQSAIDDFGRVPYSFVAVGCIYVHEAYRRGRYTISTSQTEKMVAQFKTSRHGINLNPYDIILLADELIYGKPPEIDQLPGYFLQVGAPTLPLLGADTDQPLFFTDYELPDQNEIFDKFKTGRTVLNQNSTLADISGGVTLTQSILTTTDARTVLLRDPIYLESGLTYFITFQTLEGPVEYVVDPTWTGTKYDIKVTSDIAETLPEKAVFSLRVLEFNELPKPFRVLTITPTDSDDIVEITAVEVNRNKWDYVDGDYTGDGLVFRLDDTMVRWSPISRSVIWQIPIPASYLDGAANSLGWYGTHDGDRLTGPYIGWLKYLESGSTAGLLRNADGHARPFDATGMIYGPLDAYVSFDSVNLAWIQCDTGGVAYYTYLIPTIDGNYTVAVQTFQASSLIRSRPAVDWNGRVMYNSGRDTSTNLVKHNLDTRALISDVAINFGGLGISFLDEVLLWCGEKTLILATNAKQFVVVDPTTATVLSKSVSIGGTDLAQGQWTYLIDGNNIVFAGCIPSQGKVTILRYNVVSNTWTPVGTTGDLASGSTTAVNNIVRSRDHTGFYVSAGNNLVFLSKIGVTTLVESFTAGTTISSIHRVLV